MRYEQADLQTFCARIESALDGGHEPGRFRERGNIGPAEERLQQARSSLAKLDQHLAEGSQQA
jgi:hypothetical protein